MMPRLQPETLFHYTNLAAFQNIILNAELWATHYRYMNDYTEFSDGYQLICDHVDTINHPDIGIVAESGETDAVFITCFSPQPDHLGLWRAYGGAGGVAVGFETEALLAGTRHQRDSLKPDEYTPRLGQVVYERETYIDLIGTRFSRSQPIDGDAMLHLAACRKWAEWRSEDEWRLTVSDYVGESDHWKYRTSRFGFTPYLPLNLGDLKNMLRVVRLGPGPYREERQTSVSLFLKAHDLAASVKVSQIPPR